MIADVQAYDAALASLRRRWAAFSVLLIAFLWLGFYFLNQSWSSYFSARWLILGLIVAGYEIWLLWKNLVGNHRLNETLLMPTLGAGNIASLIRGALLASLAGFLIVPRPEGNLAWLPGIVYTVAALIDFVDGVLARWTNHVTALGEILDINLDGLGVLTATLLLVVYGQVPVWYLLVGAARYFFLAGLWLRQRLHLPVYHLPPSITRRMMAGWQMGFIFVMLWPIFTPPGTHYAAAFFGVPFLGGFAWDWLIVSGLAPANRSSRLSHFARTLSGGLPIFLRFVTLGLSLIVLLQRWQKLSFQSIWHSHGLFPVLGALLVVTVFILFGISGRFLAILGLILLGFYQIVQPLSFIEIALAAVFCAILFLGTGDYSLWKPEDRLIYHRLGE